MSILYPDLGVPQAVNDKLYAQDCRIYTPESPNGPFSNVKDTFMDVFIIAHVLGWWGKALMLRDWRLAWILCILWEVIEYSTQHILVNFHECWCVEPMHPCVSVAVPGA